MRWDPAFSWVVYIARFDSDSGPYEGYMRLEWLTPDGEETGWVGLIRMGSQAKANVAHWDEHFP
jgi:hypothetical protein